jgi:murein L,D-transpeptidase YafK
MRIFWIFLFCFALSSSLNSAIAQPVDTDMDVYYTTDRTVTMFHLTDTTRAYMHLKLREPVYVLKDRENGWKEVRTLDGANGMVQSKLLSNVWIRISKTEQTLFAYQGGKLVARIPTDLGYNFFADKERRGNAGDPDHWRTPEGQFFVVSKNPHSQFYKAFVLNYPNAEDAERGLRDSIITQVQYDAIVQAERTVSMPLMNTELGGFIEIHGDGTGKRNNWTQGCIAIDNKELDKLWDLIVVGTPVLIDP